GLGTGRRLVPTATLRGTLEAAGTLNGPLKNAEFSGTLRHRDGENPPSQVSGTVRLDGRGDTLGVAADVVADSLSFDGLRGSFPGLPVAGSVAGPVRLGGSLAALTVHAELHAAADEEGEADRLQVDGVLGVAGPRFSARELVVRGTGVDLERWLGTGEGALAPPSSLNFRLS